MFNKKLDFLFILVFIASFINAQTVFKITVFEDSNNNWIYDNNENVIEGVKVSNQYTTVRTDKNGRCELPKGEHDFIFVVKPPNYNLPLNKYNIPIFYNNYDKNVSCGINFSGKNNDELYFPLIKAEKKDDFNVLVLGDPQSRNETEISYMRDDFVSKFVNTSYNFAIFLGDIVYDNKQLYEQTNKVLAKLNIPMYFVPGNHDMDYDSDGDKLSLESFKKTYGPQYYSFEYGNVHFIVLDNIDYKGNIDGKKTYTGGIDKQQLIWLKSDLDNTEPDKLVVINMHIPVNSIGGDYDANKILNKDELFEILDSREKVILLCGHTHTQEHNFYYTKNNKEIRQYICGAVCGSWWSGLKDYRGIPFALQLDGTPRGYNVFEFSGSKYKQSYYSLNYSKDYQVRAFITDGITTGYDSLYCYANVFNGNKYTKVKFILNNKIEILGENFVTGDALIDKMIKSNPSLFKSWMHAENTSHIWRGKLPNNLQSGIYSLTVEVIDEYGNKYFDNIIFEIKNED
jgi:predicted phosphodiesterase